MSENDRVAREDGTLIQQALAKATGANIHRVKAMVGMYRSSLGHHPTAAAIFEQGLREFVRTGDLSAAKPGKKNKPFPLPDSGQA